ncbi:ABC-F family ATP-binding cassette domain-containing protein [Luteolibacter ambystomatis]|uniref:ABC-F family ATP-binding cassette domain-containing protein n=1 Tax=Luteolibacter ambystomatis TaxID=2824561 RepID=A0A975PGZ4_9BACT|nr:ABC-F family ATP-binding cassette domain-containing protein [Luteolibacter ambystomatis]QUE52766.1 ABC-F family ATP-binding cassette domain-containing protein [Luteolibacter ambystomatis]
MLSIQSLRVEYGARVLFSDLAFTVQAKERIAFAGHNGAGKSTLMKCIAGIIQPTAGRINMPKGTRIGYLPQEGIHVKGRTLWDETESAFGETIALREKIERLSNELEKLDPRSSPYGDLLEEIGELELQLDDVDPDRMKPKIESVLQGLGFSKKDFTRDCGEFSGGWQMRIAMAKLFLQEPAALLLDEPTNHLDIGTQRWVEEYLKSYPGAILLISHDRGLLDTLCTRTIAFSHGRAEEYAGNFSYFERESVLRKEIRLKQYTAQQREIADIQRFIDRFRASANKATLVQSRIKMLDKIERIPAPEQDDAVMNFRFPNPPASGQSVAKLDNVSKAYGHLQIFKGFDFEATRGEKIAIVGPNGAGKSTFCRMITGQEAPDDGSHNFGHKVATSFFSQNHADELDPTKTVLETVEEVASRENVAQARSLLGCFLFRGDDVFKKVGVLSGGERSRVALVRMLLQPANFLILDEPTNHLDMQSQDVLQRALIDYSGTVMIVSHNRYFLDPLVTKTLEFRPGEDPRVFVGNITYYLDKIAEEEKAERNSPAKLSKRPATPVIKPIVAPQPAAAPAETAGNRKDQRRQDAELRQKRAKVLKPLEDEFAALEKKIAELEVAQNTLTEHLSDPAVAADPDKFRQASNAVASVTTQLETAYSRWAELSEEIEKLSAQFAG